MRSFSKVSPNVWQSQRFNALPDDSRLLYFYLLTSPHANSAGAYRLPSGYVCTDLRWQSDRYMQALNQLIDADLIAHDEAESIVIIKRWFQHNPPMNEKHFRGVVRILSNLPQVACVQETTESIHETWYAKGTEGKSPGTSSAIEPRHHLLNTNFMNGRG